VQQAGCLLSARPRPETQNIRVFHHLEHTECPQAAIEIIVMKQLKTHRVGVSDN
jgi:hypothetical protein